MLLFWYHNSQTHLFVFVHQAPLRVRAKTNKQTKCCCTSFSLPQLSVSSVSFPSRYCLSCSESWPYCFLKRCNARDYRTAGSRAAARSPEEAARRASTPSTTPFPGLWGSCCPCARQHHPPWQHRVSWMALRPSSRCVGLKDLLYVPMRP